MIGLGSDKNRIIHTRGFTWPLSKENALSTEKKNVNGEWKGGKCLEKDKHLVQRWWRWRWMTTIRTEQCFLPCLMDTEFCCNNLKKVELVKWARQMLLSAQETHVTFLGWSALSFQSHSQKIAILLNLFWSPKSKTEDFLEWLEENHFNFCVNHKI